ncbi:MAG TPA: Xaa-Pro peptidase family protein [Thermodesulfobacteriota bacterium]|nr:Xaa-Pro peptidase family protein [Thermodesulfobacteriota bacterium]
MIPQSEMERRWKLLREKMEVTGVDLILATSQENFYYLTGSYHPDLKAIPDRLAFAGMGRDGNLFAFVSDLEFPLFKTQSPIREARAYVEFQEPPVPTLTNFLSGKGLSKKKIGFECRHLVHEYALALREGLPEAELTPWDRYFFAARRFKSPFEIDLLQKAAGATERGIYDAWLSVHPGVSEKEMARELEAQLRKGGADAVSFVTCASGARTAVPHAAASSAPIQRGDLIKVDIGGVFDGYYSDMARSAFMAEVSPVKKDEYLKVVAAHKAIIEEMSPGVTAAQVFRVGKKIFQNLGVPFDVPHLGHAIGLTGHEEVLLQPKDETELRPGMVIAVEQRAKFREERYHIEDLVLIEEDGPRVLTNIDANESVFVIS